RRLLPRTLPAGTRTAPRAHAGLPARAARPGPSPPASVGRASAAHRGQARWAAPRGSAGTPPPPPAPGGHRVVRLRNHRGERPARVPQAREPGPRRRLDRARPVAPVRDVRQVAADPGRRQRRRNRHRSDPHVLLKGLAMDIVFRGARVVDGSGEPGYVADVGITDGRIAAIERARLSGTRVVDADGLVLAPGFIDMHSHSDIQILADPDRLAKVSQGVTTEVLGQDGLSYAPVDDKVLEALRAQLAGWNDDPPGFDWNWRTV